MTPEEIEERARKIRDIYQQYLGRLFDLKKEQDKIIANLENTLKEEEIREIKKTIGL